MKKNISEEWSFCPGFAGSALNRIPENSVSFRLEPETLTVNLDSLLAAPAPVMADGMVYNRFTLDEESPLAFGACCDWWFEAYLNGKLIYTTFPAGNASGAFLPADHTFPAQGQKGENLLAIHVRRGKGSWQFGFAENDAEIADPCIPITICAVPNAITGSIKPMNAVNNGPVLGPSNNLELWKAAKIPFARNHDAAHGWAYGGEHIVDVNVIFPDFSADVDDPASYDFDLTDDYLESTLNAGTQIFYRIGSKIEPQRKKYGTKVPPDFAKWAQIGEHIIRHYNEGWANGHCWNIRYWEIWNEPDLDPEDAPNRRTWQGSEQEFYELYQVTAKHLKKCFPHLKIGGPALSGQFPWMKRFLKAMREADVPMDFFSWHFYGTQPAAARSAMEIVRKALDENGYTQTESILDEWNYVRDWNNDCAGTVLTIIGLKGAIFAASVMCEGQNAPLDMLMYYDARPCWFNGLFDYYTYAPLKTYHVFRIWAELANLGKQFQVDTHGKNGIFAVGATDGKTRGGLLITRYFEPDTLPGELQLGVDVQGMKAVKVRLLDQTHDFEEIPFKLKDGVLTLAMKANSAIYVELQKAEEK